MITRTEKLQSDSVMPYCSRMEDAGWAVRQIVPIPTGRHATHFIVVLERERE